MFSRTRENFGVDEAKGRVNFAASLDPLELDPRNGCQGSQVFNTAVSSAFQSWFSENAADGTDEDNKEPLHVWTPIEGADITKGSCRLHFFLEWVPLYFHFFC